MIRITAFIGFLAISQGVTNIAFAEESPATAPAGVSQAIAHIEQAITEIRKSDFNTAQVHLKAARTAAETINTNEEQVKKANALVIQGQIKAKKGDIENSTAELNKALEIYRSL